MFFDEEVFDCIGAVNGLAGVDFPFQELGRCLTVFLLRRQPSIRGKCVPLKGSSVPKKDDAATRQASDIRTSFRISEKYFLVLHNRIHTFVLLVQRIN